MLGGKVATTGDSPGERLLGTELRRRQCHERLEWVDGDRSDKDDIDERQ
jgi:hypothetical protein